MDISSIKYEYSPSGGVVPCARLKKGASGIIHRVSFYSDGDIEDVLMYMLKEQIFTLKLPLSSYSRIYLGIGEGDPIPPTLEKCSDEHLQAISRVRNGSLPLEELTQLRELERYLRRTPRDYRQT